MYAPAQQAAPLGTEIRNKARTETEIVAMLPALRAFSKHFEKNASDADDLVQETLMRALRSLHQFEVGSSLKSWLFTIMRNTYCNIYKKKTREPVGRTECVSSWTTDCSATQEWSVIGRELQTALEGLAPERREVLMLIALGTSYEEAASICGCAVGTIKSRVSRARGDLASAMGGSAPADCFA